MAQEPGQHGPHRSVAAPRGRQRTVQADLQGGHARQKIRRQAAGVLQEVVGGQHGADGMGAGRAGADLEQFED